MDDDDRDSNASSFNDQDEPMDDAEDMEVDNEEYDDNNDNDDNEDEQEDEYVDNEDEDSHEQAAGGVGDLSANEQGSQDTGEDAKDSNAVCQKSLAATNQKLSAAEFMRNLKPRPESITAKLYDIVPTMAAPQATSINSLAITPDLRYWMTGGSDGYVRKYNGIDTINGKQLLTVAQRHPFVDSVVKAGVLLSYWENFEPPSSTTAKGEENVLSPVYSLAVHSQALWCLAGLESGGINMQTVRHWEGTRITCLQKHTNACSVLTLAADERSVLSGSWDKSIFDWDLNTGSIKRSFDGNGSQISALEVRPASGAPIPLDDYDEPMLKDEFSNNMKPLSNGVFSSGIEDPPPGLEKNDTMPTEGQASPADESLFGGGSDAGSLFGDTGAFGNDDDDDFSRAMDMSIQQDPMQDSTLNDTNLGENNLMEGGLNAEGDMSMSMDMTFEPDPAPSGVEGDNNTLDLNDSNMTPGEGDLSWTSADAPDPVLALAEPGTLNGIQDTALPSIPVTSTNDSNVPVSMETPSQPLDFSLSASIDSMANAPLTKDLPSMKLEDNTEAGLPSITAPDASVSAHGGTSTMLFAEPLPTHLDSSQTADSTFLSAAIDGTLRIWDRRMMQPAARIGNRPGVPPWCMGACWSPDGDMIYVGRRNGTVDEFSIHKARAGWEPERSLKFPAGSGAVSAVRPMVNGRHLVCASHDILRLYDLKDQSAFKHSKVPFVIIPGPPRAGVISQLWIDPTSQFMVSAAGTRGWDGTCTEVLIGYEIGIDSK